MATKQNYLKVLTFENGYPSPTIRHLFESSLLQNHLKLNSSPSAAPPFSAAVSMQQMLNCFLCPYHRKLKIGFRAKPKNFGFFAANAGDGDERRRNRCDGAVVDGKDCDPTKDIGFFFCEFHRASMAIYDVLKLVRADVSTILLFLIPF
ncbi:unnamed protein product [Lactuca virosa]|uniref:Uncharacterized protein n=1 Tax=Lactuca virosa TaxID=75947 RepID=A0AAU9PMX4_9ASTR|nr:unnamed protein product [Lactuca virosa]